MTKQEMRDLLARCTGEENTGYPATYQPTLTGFGGLLHDVISRAEDVVHGMAHGFEELQNCCEDEPTVFVGWRAKPGTTSFMTLQGGLEEHGKPLAELDAREKLFASVEAWAVQFDWDGQPGVVLHCEDGPLLVTVGITEDGYFGEEGTLGYLADALLDKAMQYATAEVERLGVAAVEVTLCEEDTIWAAHTN